MNTFEDIATWLHSSPGRVRVTGSGSRAHTLPPMADATPLQLSQFNRIERFDAGDQTCTVESGVTRVELDVALAEHNLELPCLGGGTIGGLFAADPFGPAAAGCPGPRNLLLGLDALLADGSAFKSGARVVKSVAGFDVHKLFVGSHGRLFVATKLHLRLKPRPRTEQWFANDTLERDQALKLVHALRQEAEPPTVLQLRRERNGSFTVSGRVTGRSVHVTSLCKRHELVECGQPTSFHVDVTASAGEEVLTGDALPSALPSLIKALPENTPFTWLGGGRFEAAMPNPQATDAALQQLPQANASGTILTGADTRRGVGTPTDPGEQRLAVGLKNALDPNGILV
ncbi:MAG: FAD/FMN-containing dehydrogenase [Hyphomicrobiaceae bacterium]